MGEERNAFSRGCRSSKTLLSAFMIARKREDWPLKSSPTRPFNCLGRMSNLGLPGFSRRSYEVLLAHPTFEPKDDGYPFRSFSRASSQRQMSQSVQSLTGVQYISWSPDVWSAHFWRVGSPYRNHNKDAPPHIGQTNDTQSCALKDDKSITSVPLDLFSTCSFHRTVFPWKSRQTMN